MVIKQMLPGTFTDTISQYAFAQIFTKIQQIVL